MTPFSNPLKNALMLAAFMLLLFALISAVQRMRDASAQASAEARQSRAESGVVVESIKDASGAVARTEAKSEAIVLQVEEARHEIEQANSVGDITRIGSERLREHRNSTGKP
jgi:hypothetical protein